MQLLKDKIALVTGASRGIGSAICLKFAEEGATVYAGMRNTDHASDLLSRAAASTGKVIPIGLDVCDSASVKQCAMDIHKREGKLDILVNNAGITILERFDMLRTKSLDSIYNVNVFGLLTVTQMTMRLLKKSASPCIINMSSIMAEESDIGQTAYASSKAAVESMTRTWTKEYASLGFRVNAIAPGNVDTDMFNIISDEERAKEIAKIGLGRVARPEEIANAALFLASDMASYVTGEVLHVNGGLNL